MFSHKRIPKVNPDVIKEIKSKELELEHYINIYRFFLFIILLLFVNLYMYFEDLLESIHFIVVLPLTLVVCTGIISLHFLTRKNRSVPLLKYITVSVDYLLVYGMLFEARELILSITNLSMEQYLLLSSISFILINFFSALRIQVQVIFFSTLLGIFLNSLIHFNYGSTTLVIIYTDVFILLSGLFNNFISGYIYNSFLINHKLSETLKSLELAHKEISLKNDEIITKNAELEAQNDDLYRQHQEILRQKKQITSSIEYASKIQNAVLNSVTEIKLVAPDSFILFKPKNIVSGDFYWFKKVNVFTKDYHIICAADCTGHGVPGAFMSMLGISFLNDIVTEFYSELNVAEILNRLRQEVKDHLHQEEEGNRMIKDGMDIALCAMDYENMVMQFAGANNPLYIIRKQGGKYASEIVEVNPDKMPIGIHPRDKLSFKKSEIKMSKGDMVYVFSDGFADQFGGENGGKFLKRRLRETLVEIAHLPLLEQKNFLEQKLDDWMGGNYQQIDDITLIGVRI